MFVYDNERFREQGGSRLAEEVIEKNCRKVIPVVTRARISVTGRGAERRDEKAAEEKPWEVLKLSLRNSRTCCAWNGPDSGQAADE
jgi:hypothetical protein